jgi:hypothetical protein
MRPKNGAHLLLGSFQFGKTDLSIPKQFGNRTKPSTRFCKSKILSLKKMIRVFGLA